jgi:hypothetical protein
MKINMERVQIDTFVRVAGNQGVGKMCRMDACRGPPEKRTLPSIRTALERQSESAASAATHIVACFSNLEPLYLIVLLVVVFFPRAWNLVLWIVGPEEGVVADEVGFSRHEQQLFIFLAGMYLADRHYGTESCRVGWFDWFWMTGGESGRT